MLFDLSKLFIQSLQPRQLYEKRPLNQWAFFFEEETSDVPADIA
jgi:hypothetical protein